MQWSFDSTTYSKNPFGWSSYFLLCVSVWLLKGHCAISKIFSPLFLPSSLVKKTFRNVVHHRCLKFLSVGGKGTFLAFLKSFLGNLVTHDFLDYPRSSEFLVLLSWQIMTLIFKVVFIRLRGHHLLTADCPIYVTIYP